MNHRHAETCSCGASIEVEGAAVKVADTVRQWRTSHKHVNPQPRVIPSPYQPQPTWTYQPPPTTITSHVAEGHTHGG